MVKDNIKQMQATEKSLIISKEEKEILNKFKINPEALNNFMIENNKLETKGINFLSSEEENDNKIILPSGEIVNNLEEVEGDTYKKIASYISKNLTQAKDVVVSDIAYEKYTNAPFKYTSDNEEVYLYNGELTYKEELANIEGRNGFDMNLSIAYNSEESNIYGEGYWKHNSIVDKYYVKCWGEAYYVKYPKKLVVNGHLNCFDALRASSIYDIQQGVDGPHETCTSSGQAGRDWVNNIAGLSSWTHIDEPERNTPGSLPYYYRKCGDNNWFADMSHLIQYLKSKTVHSEDVVTKVENVRYHDTYTERHHL